MNKEYVPEDSTQPKPGPEPSPWVDIHPHGYPEWRHRDGEKERHVLIHRLLAVAEYGFEAVVDMHVHHENGIKWDNRHENVRPMTPSEHAKLHSN